MDLKKASLVLLLLGTVVTAQAAKKEVVPADPFFLPSLPGSQIVGYEEQKLATYSVPTGSLRTLSASGKMAVKGKVTKITYEVNSSAFSTADVMEYYKSTLLKNGFEILYTDAGDRLAPANQWAETYYPDATCVHGETKSQVFASARKQQQDACVYTTVFASQGWYSHPVLQVEVVEESNGLPDEAEKKRIPFLKELLKNGRIVIAGISYEGNSAEPTEYSEKSLQDITLFLKAYPLIKCYIVGHTDNAQSFDEAMALSLKRATGVVELLTQRYRVDPQRLTATGAGALCPIAANDKSGGREKNNRVELVVQ